MDHRTVISALSADELGRLGARSDAKGLRHLAGHLAVIAGFSVRIAQGWPLWQVALPAQGIALCFLFTLEHEATHKTPFANGRLNEWAGRIVGLVILNLCERFRYFHLAHHRHTNIPAQGSRAFVRGQAREPWRLHPACQWLALLGGHLFKQLGKLQDKMHRCRGNHG